MFFIITALAAIISTIIWYVKIEDNKYNLGTLSLIYWGATLMWLVDHVIEFLAEGGSFFEITLSATLLGIAVIGLGLLAWITLVIIKNPKVFLILKKMHKF